MAQQLVTRIRTWIILFMVGLIASGITAFPIEAQLEFAVKHPELIPDNMTEWINRIYTGIKTTNKHFPFIAYGTDWLAFAHIVIAVAFIGPLKDPVRNIWVIRFGMIACVMVIPFALIAGPVRGIPLYWRLIDCSFGIIGFIPLYFCYRDIRKLENYQVKPVVSAIDETPVS